MKKTKPSVVGGFKNKRSKYYMKVNMIILNVLLEESLINREEYENAIKELTRIKQNDINNNVVYKTSY